MKTGGGQGRGRHHYPSHPNPSGGWLNVTAPGRTSSQMSVVGLVPGEQQVGSLPTQSVILTLSFTSLELAQEFPTSQDFLYKTTHLHLDLKQEGEDTPRVWTEISFQCGVPPKMRPRQRYWRWPKWFWGSFKQIIFRLWPIVCLTWLRKWECRLWFFAKKYYDKTELKDIIC